MKRPKQEKLERYLMYARRLDAFIDQLEAEKKSNKEILQNAQDCIEWMNGLTTIENSDLNHYTNRVLNCLAELEREIQK